MKSNHKKALVVTALVIATSATYYGYITSYTGTHTDKNTVLRKLTRVKPADMATLKASMETRAERCPEQKLQTISLLRNGKLVWKKTHDEFFALDGVQITNKGPKDTDKLMPIKALFTNDNSIKRVTFSSCTASTEAVTLTVNQLSLPERSYYLGLNKKGWMKLILHDEHGGYRTALRPVTDVMLSTN